MQKWKNESRKLFLIRDIKVGTAGIIGIIVK